jgi:hypothetical protein
MNFNSKQKNFAGTEEKSILWLTVGETVVTDTEGATFLADMSVSNISKLCRPSKSDSGKEIPPKVVSQKQGKGRFVSVESLKTYYNSERREPGLQSKLNDHLALFLESLKNGLDERVAQEVVETFEDERAAIAKSHSKS